MRKQAGETRRKHVDRLVLKHQAAKLVALSPDGSGT